MHSLQTTTGEGSAIVTVSYSIESDDFNRIDCEIDTVMFNGVNILDALSVEQYETLTVECHAAALTAEDDAKADRAEHEYQNRRDDALMEQYA